MILILHVGHQIAKSLEDKRLGVDITNISRPEPMRLSGVADPYADIVNAYCVAAPRKGSA